MGPQHKYPLYQHKLVSWWLKLWSPNTYQTNSGSIFYNFHLSDNWEGKKVRCENRSDAKIISAKNILTSGPCHHWGAQISTEIQNYTIAGQEPTWWHIAWRFRDRSRGATRVQCIDESSPDNAFFLGACKPKLPLDRFRPHIVSFFSPNKLETLYN